MMSTFFGTTQGFNATSVKSTGMVRSSCVLIPIFPFLHLRQRVHCHANCVVWECCQGISIACARHLRVLLAAAKQNSTTRLNFERSCASSAHVSAHLCRLPPVSQDRPMYSLGPLDTSGCPPHVQHIPVHKLLNWAVSVLL